MKILVTGSAGFLGTQFMRYLIGQNRHEIWSVDLKPAEFPNTQEDIVDFLKTFSEKIDLTLHFAAPVGGRVRIEGDPLYNADSLRIDSVLFRWAIEHCKNVVYPSSSAVYPASLQADIDGAIRLREEEFHPKMNWWGSPDEMYGFTKLAAEVLAWKSVAYGLNTLCIRPFSGYGPGQSFEYPIPSIARRALAKEDPLVVWGSGRQKRDFIHVFDIVRATMKVVEHGWTGYVPLNLGSGTGTSFNDVAGILTELVGYRPVISTDESKPQGVNNRVADPAKMLRAYTPKVTLRDGLQTVLDHVSST